MGDGYRRPAGTPISCRAEPPGQRGEGAEHGPVLSRLHSRDMLSKTIVESVRSVCGKVKSRSDQGRVSLASHCHAVPFVLGRMIQPSGAGIQNAVAAEESD